MKTIVNLVPEAFFDFFSYFLPGIFFVLPIARTVNFWSIFQGREVGAVWEVIAYFVAAYIFGHLLTTVSYLLIAKPINYFIGDPADSLIGIGKARIPKFQARLERAMISGIENIVSRKFKVRMDRHSFFLCENYVRTTRPDIGFLIRKRHAFEHLFRNLVVACLVLIPLVTDSTWLIRALFLSILVISLVRYFDYRVSWPKAVFENFYLLTVEETENGQKSRNAQ
jgi:hypothetical protein